MPVGAASHSPRWAFHLNWVFKTNDLGNTYISSHTKFLNYRYASHLHDRAGLRVGEKLPMNCVCVSIIIIFQLSQIFYILTVPPTFESRTNRAPATSSDEPQSCKPNSKSSKCQILTRSALGEPASRCWSSPDTAADTCSSPPAPGCPRDPDQPTRPRTPPGSPGDCGSRLSSVCVCGEDKNKTHITSGSKNILKSATHAKSVVHTDSPVVQGVLHRISQHIFGQ